MEAAVRADDDDLDDESSSIAQAKRSESRYYPGVHETDPFPLHAAARQGNENAVNRLVSSGAVEVDAANEEGATALLHATGGGHLACVRALLSLGADVNAADHTGCTALQVATLVGNEDIVGVLLDAGADINRADNAGHTALTIAQSGEHLAVLSVLEAAAVGRYLQAGGSSQAARAEVQLAADLSAAELASMEQRVAQRRAERASADRTRPTDPSADNGPFAKEGLQSVQYMAAKLQAEKTGLAKELIQIEVEKIRVSRQDPMLAEQDGGPSDAALLTQLAELDAELARRADADVQHLDEAVDAQVQHARLLVKEVNEARRLVAKRTDADEAEAELTERDQMHTAAASGREEDLMDLLHRGTHVDIRDPYLRTPLQIAAMYGHTHCVERLLENKADPNNTDFLSNADHEGCTALAQAAMNGRDDTVLKLLEHRADIELSDFYGCTPLHLASQHGRDTVVKSLLENGANINAADSRGWTALHRAAAAGEVKVVEHLVGHSVDQSARDDEGKTAFHTAKELGHDNVLMLLNQVESGHSIETTFRPVGTERGGYQHAVQTLQEMPPRSAEEPEISARVPKTTALPPDVVRANTPESRHDVAAELIRMRELQLERMVAERQSIREEKAELQRLKENALEETAQMIAQQKAAEEARADAERAAADAAAQAAVANQQADRAAAAPLAHMPHSFGHSDAVARGRQDAAALAVDYAAQRQAAVDASQARKSSQGSVAMEMWGTYSRDGLFGILAAPEGSDSDLNTVPTRPVLDASSAARHPADGEDWAEGPYGYRWELSDVGRALCMGGFEGLSSSAKLQDNHQILPDHPRPPARVSSAGAKKLGVLERSLAFSAEELSEYEDSTAKALEAAGVPEERAKDAAVAATAAVAETEQRVQAWEDAEKAAAEEQEHRSTRADQLQPRPVPPPRPTTSQTSKVQTAQVMKRKNKPNKFLAGPAADFVPYDPREKFGPLTEPKPNLSVEALGRARRGDSKAPRPFSFEERENERRRNRPTKLTVAAAMAAEKAAKEEEHIMEANRFRAKEVPNYLKQSLNIAHNKPAISLAEPFSLIEWSYEDEGTLGVFFGDYYPYVKHIQKDTPADAVPGLTAYCKLLSIEIKELHRDADGDEMVATRCVKTDGLSHEEAKDWLRMRPLKLKFKKLSDDEEQRKKLVIRRQAVKKRVQELQSLKQPVQQNAVEWSFDGEGTLGVVFADQYPYVKKIHTGTPADAVPGLTTDCKLLSIELGERRRGTRGGNVDHEIVYTRCVKTDGLSYEDAKVLLRMRPLKLRFAKGGWRAKPVPKACDCESVGRLDKMAQLDEERKRRNREKAEANYRKAQAPHLSPTTSKRSAKIRASLDKRQAAVAHAAGAVEGQNKDNPFEQRWAGWLRSEGLQSDASQSLNPMLSMRQLQRACRKVAGLPPLSGAEMEHALRKMKISDLVSPSNPDVACVTAEQAKKWVREQQHILCWNRVQSSAAGLPLASATKVLADIIADEHRLPETRWPNLGPRHKVPRAHFVEDRPKIVFETTDETHYREVLQMSDAEQMELAKAQAAITVKLMQEQQQQAGAAAGRHEGHREMQVSPEAEAERLYANVAKVATKQERAEESVDADVAWEQAASADADPRAVTWNDLAQAGSGDQGSGAAPTSTSPPAPTEKSTVTSLHNLAQNTATEYAAPTPGDMYMARKTALDIQKQELLALEAQRARKRAARAQHKNELLRLAAELPPA